MNSVRCAAILAGGLSSRMGRDKALLEMDGQPLVRRAARVLQPLFERTIVVTNREDVARAARIPFVSDAHELKGPLAGIEAALSLFGEPVFFAACDAPFLNPDFIAFQCGLWREEFDALVAQSHNGLEPLHAVWSPSCLPSIQLALKQERPPSLRRVLNRFHIGVIEVEDARRFDPKLRMFENWNTPDDILNDIVGAD